MDNSTRVVSGILGVGIFLVAVIFLLNPAENTVSEISSVDKEDIIIEESISSPIKKELTLIQLFENSEEGVVRIDVDRKSNERNSDSVGSGFVFDYQGHIITNAHVVENSDEIKVTFLDGSTYKAKKIGEDKFTDIAVIKVEEVPTALHPLKIGDSSKLQVGQRIAAIGNPFGLSGSMTSGIVSQIGRLLPSQDTGFSIPDVIQTDAAINPGNSGGPLLNTNGEVIGINSAIQSTTGEFTGVGFSIPSKTFSKIVPKLIEEEQYKHPWIGISGRDVDPDLAKIRNLDSAKGFLVITVVDDSPAQKAGLLGVSETKEIDGKEYPINGDIVVSVDSKEVRKISDILTHLQREKSVGEEMELGIIRDGKLIFLTIILHERPSE